MTKNIDIQRFKGALVSGCWPSNPEPLVRDAKGDFVKYSDHEEIISLLLEQLKELKEKWNDAEGAYHKLFGEWEELTEQLKQKDEVINDFITEYCDRHGEEDLPVEAENQSCPVIKKAMLQLVQDNE